MSNYTPVDTNSSHPSSNTERLYMFYPGFTWGEHSNQAFISSLEKYSKGNVTSGRYFDEKVRSQPDPRKYGYEPATPAGRLAAHYLIQLEKELGGEKVEVVPITFSNGTLIEQAARRLDKQHPSPLLTRPSGLGVHLAPSGSMSDESLARLMGRYTPQAIWLGRHIGPSHPAYIEQIRNFVREPIERLKGAGELANELVDYDEAEAGGYKPHALLFSDDRVFPVIRQLPYLQQRGIPVRVWSEEGITIPHSAPLLYPEQTAEKVAEIILENNALLS